MGLGRAGDIGVFVSDRRLWDGSVNQTDCFPFTTELSPGFYTDLADLHSAELRILVVLCSCFPSVPSRSVLYRFASQV